ncbi:MAG: hypothetical protein Q9172_001283 [Xanthocarpia lactea]
MQLALILSDLTSLRVCDHAAALALVSTRAPASDISAPAVTRLHRSKDTHEVDNDPDMERAMDLIELHQEVKMKHGRGEDQGLTQARKDVDAVLVELERVAAERGLGSR